MVPPRRLPTVAVVVLSLLIYSAVCGDCSSSSSSSILLLAGVSAFSPPSLGRRGYYLNVGVFPPSPPRRRRSRHDIIPSVKKYDDRLLRLPRLSLSDNDMFDSPTDNRDDDDDDGENDFKSYYTSSKIPDDDDDDDDPDADDDEHSHNNDVDDNDDNTSSSSSSKIISDTNTRIEEQQRQIDFLMKMLQDQDERRPSSFIAPSVPADVARRRRRQSSSSLPDESVVTATTTASPMTPLKVMLFIDGTWLYYSIHQRRENNCPIIKQFGRGWQHYYKFDWAALPRLICEQLQLQQSTKGWSTSSTSSTSRPMEIVRASVYTSYKKSTDKNSLRVRMFDDMSDCNYDVHRMETLGEGEKCVDIQLAVEMLHYATVPNAYDVAVLLSGDKDFIPALVRTRQKGKQLAVVSMRMGCNRALFESPHVKDYDILFLDDFLEGLIVPLTRGESSAGVGVSGRKRKGIVSAVTMLKVIYDFVSHVSGGVSSRDIGRYLKTMEISGSNMLEQLKDVYGGLRHFLAQHGEEVFLIMDQRDVNANTGTGVGKKDPRDKSFWVDVIDETDADDYLVDEAKRTTFSREEQQFIKSYYDGNTENENLNEDAYYHTFEDPNTKDFYTPRQLHPNRDVNNNNHNDNDNHENVSPPEQQRRYNQIKDFELPPELQIDYSTYTVAKMKDRCRERGLHVSGTKAVLLQRIRDDVQDQISQLKRQHAADAMNGDAARTTIRAATRGPSSSSSSFQTSTSRKNNNHNAAAAAAAPELATTIPRHRPTRSGVDPAVTQHLDSLITEYLTASGGTASSRDVGRYLAAHPGVGGDLRRMGDGTALKELKDHYGSLAQYLGRRGSLYYPADVNSNVYGDKFGFPVRLRR